jgi:hypothetical protein
LHKTAKALQRLLQNSKALKIKHLLKFFAVLQSIAKTILPDPPDPTRPTQANQPVFSIHISITAKLQNKKQKINQIIDFQGFEVFAVFFAVALQRLCGFVLVC